MDPDQINKTTLPNAEPTSAVPQSAPPQPPATSLPPQSNPGTETKTGVPTPTEKITPQPEFSPLQIPATEKIKPALQTSAQIEIDKILLPKKRAEPSRLSAQRVNAAAVLEAASAPLVPTAARVESLKSVAPETEYAATKKDAIPALHTYKTDVEDTVRDKNISLADIARAQLKQRATTTVVPEEPGVKRKRAFQIAGGVVLIAAALGAIVFALSRPQTLPQKLQQNGTFIYIDDIRPITVGSAESRGTLLANLTSIRDSIKLSLGLVSRLDLEQAGEGTAQSPLTSQEFVSILKLQVPDSLVRSLSPVFLLGIHATAGNQPFLIFKTNSYEQSFAGMLQWEPNLQSDLSPLFDYTPSPHINDGSALIAASTTTPIILSTPFVDQVVDNHDARVIKNGNGDIVLLWTFLDRSTLLITTNELTLHEVTTRLAQTPTAPILGQ